MKKFMLVPPQTLPSPLTRKLSQLDEEMKLVLDRNDLSDSEKARAYSEILDKYLDVKRRLQQPTPIPIVDNPQQTHQQAPSKQTIDLNLIPQQYRTRAQNLLSHVEKHSDLDWNGKGELLVRGQPVIGSHIADLIDDTVRAKVRATVQEPVGVREFIDGLKQSNVPQALIGNKNRFTRLQTPERLQSPPSTPRVRRPRVSDTVSDTVRRNLQWEPLP